MPLISKMEIEYIVNRRWAWIYRNIKQGQFPTFIQLSQNEIAFRPEHIARWILKLPIDGRRRGEPNRNRVEIGFRSWTNSHCSTFTCNQVAFPSEVTDWSESSSS